MANVNRIQNIGLVDVCVQQQQQQQQRKIKRKRKRNTTDDNDNNGAGIRMASNRVSLYADRVRCACAVCNSRSEQTFNRCASNDFADSGQHVPIVVSSTNNGDHRIVDVTKNEANFLRPPATIDIGSVAIGRRDGTHRFAVYENLCEFCGFAIGSGSYHQYCGVRADVTNNNHNNANRQQQQQQQQLNTRNSFSENIYENICPSCRSIYNGDKCTNCECEIDTPSKVNASDETKPKQLNRRQFGNLFGSLRQKFKERKPTPPVRKIEIVHNCDQQVFKTNQSFDLNEIVQLKAQQQQQQQLKAERRDQQHVYGKLRKNSRPVATALSGRQSNSDSNFFDSGFGAAHHQLAFDTSSLTESIVSDTCLYAAPPSYEDAIHNSSYKSVSINLSQTTTTADATSHSSSSALSLLTHDRKCERETVESIAAAIGELLVNDASLKHWMTSLRRQTHDYGCGDRGDHINDRSFDCATVKCVPSKLLHAIDSVGIAPEQSAEFNAKVCEQIEVFKVNVLERMREKQTLAIDRHTENAVNECTSATDEGIEENISETTSETINEIENVEIVELNGCACAVTNAIVDSEFGELPSSVSSSTATFIHNYLQSVKTFYIQQITASTSFNRLVLVCGDKTFHYLIKLLFVINNSSDDGSRDGSLLSKRARPLIVPRRTKYTNLNSLVIALFEMNARSQLSIDGVDAVDATSSANQRSPKSHFNDFLLETAPGSGSALKRIEDFDKSCRDAIVDQKKTFDDFIAKKSDASLTTTAIPTTRTANNDDNDSPNDIYQTIWTFNTIGQANSDSMDDECVYGSTETAAIDDCSQWEEVTEEEFLFSNDRINSTTVNHHTLCDESGASKQTMTELMRYSPYQSVCILYCADDVKYNKIIYDYNNGNNSSGNSCTGSGIWMHANASDSRDGIDSIGACSLSGSNSELGFPCRNTTMNSSRGETSGDSSTIRLDSVDAWKAWLSSSYCLEDEEDLVSYRHDTNDLPNAFEYCLLSKHFSCDNSLVFSSN